MNIWGIDLGGTKIEIVVLQSDNFQVLTRERVATEGDRGYDHIISRIQNLIDATAEKVGSGPDRIGIGTPGTIDSETQLMKNSNSTALNGKPFHSDLQDALSLHVAMANDANCFALAETRMGAVRDQAAEAKIVFGVIMGTGVGGGVIIDDKVWPGLQGIAGEWGHTFLDNSGGECYCGKTGCVETIISGPALETYYAGRSGANKKLSDILATRVEDEIAADTIDRLLHFYGKALANVINVLDPDVIVLGGGLSNIDVLYTEGLQQLDKFVFNSAVKTKIIRPKLGDSAGVFGAALLVS